MAIVLKGKNKGKEIAINQFCNDWVTDDDCNVYSPSSLQYTAEEFLNIISNKNTSIMFSLYEFDMENFRIRKIKKK